MQVVRAVPSEKNPRVAAKYTILAEKNYIKFYKENIDSENWKLRGEARTAEAKAEEAKKIAAAFRHEATKRKRKGLEEKVLVHHHFNTSLIIFIIISFVGLFFLSPNITGNVIGVSKVYSNWIGGILFVVGLIGVFVCFKSKNRKK